MIVNEIFAQELSEKAIFNNIKSIEAYHVHKTYQDTVLSGIVSPIEFIQNQNNILYYGDISARLYTEQGLQKVDFFGKDANLEVPKNYIYDAKMGFGYNWHAIMDSRNINPVGWETPVDTDHNNLIIFAGSGSVANDALKVVGSDYWSASNVGGNNSTGFAAQPTGLRSESTGLWSVQDNTQYTWSKSSYNGVSAYVLVVYSSSTSVAATTKSYKAGVGYRSIRRVHGMAEGETSTVTGNDGTVYQTKVINGIEWMIQNSIETKFQNGDLIPLKNTNAEWIANGDQPARCVVDQNNDKAYVLTIEDIVTNTSSNIVLTEKSWFQGITQTHDFLYGHRIFLGNGIDKYLDEYFLKRELFRSLNGLASLKAIEQNTSVRLVLDFQGFKISTH